MNSGHLGYYSLLDTESKNGYMGGLLVVDARGKPEEFRVTFPVKPTTIQQYLYGESLLPHIGVELCGKPLYRALDHTLDALLVNDPMFLSICEDVDCLAAYARADDGLAPMVDEGELTCLLQSPVESFQPVIVQCPLSYSDERRSNVELVLARYFQGVNLAEPFQRIDVAMKSLQRQDKRFR